MEKGEEIPVTKSSKSIMIREKRRLASLKKVNGTNFGKTRKINPQLASLAV